MQHCFFCGAEIRDGGHRRMVQTGLSRRLYQGRRRTSVATTTSKGLRTLCAACAERVDAQARFEAKVAKIKAAAIAGAIGVAAIWWASQPHPTQPAAVNTVMDTRAALPSPNPASPLPNPVELGTQTHDVVDADAGPPPATIDNGTPTAQGLPPWARGPDGSLVLLNPYIPANAAVIQSRLAGLGYHIGDPEGVWSNGSRLALRRFRVARRLGSDWLWDIRTQAALFAAAR